MVFACASTSSSPLGTVGLADARRWGQKPRLRARVSQWGGQAVLRGGLALGRSSEGTMPGGVLWSSGPHEEIKALPRLPLGTEFTMKIFCLTLGFEHAL